MKPTSRTMRANRKKSLKAKSLEREPGCSKSNELEGNRAMVANLELLESMVLGAGA